MPTPSWRISGQYYETCSCDFICLCIPSGMGITPTKGNCTVAMAFQVERGNFGHVPLDNLGFIVVACAPEAMGKGNWQVGIVVDERADPEQREAIGAIASGAARSLGSHREISRDAAGVDRVRPAGAHVVGAREGRG